uniref:Uncharacterized protein n=1 Tax=Fagus sylvatica TaxID=28930 RepID=A0A2N9IM40_FAGSY
MRRKTAANHPLQRDKSNQPTIFKLLKTLQLIPALHFIGSHDSWYCSRSRFLHNSSKITGSNQNAWEMKKYYREPTATFISVPKGTQGVAPTAQTREEAALLMLTRLEECGLVEGSQFRDLGSHELLSLELSLDEVDVDSLTIKKILKCCPLLEALTITMCTKVKRVELVNVPKLKKANVQGVNKLRIEAPNLEKLNCSGDLAPILNPNSIACNNKKTIHRNISQGPENVEESWSSTPPSGPRRVVQQSTANSVTKKRSAAAPAAANDEGSDEEDEARLKRLRRSPMAAQISTI